MRTRLADIFARLPSGFYRRLVLVSKRTESPPEAVLDRALKYEECRAGVVIDQALERQAVSQFHGRVATDTARAKGKAWTLRRSRLAAAGKHAKDSGISRDKWLRNKAQEMDMTVEEWLERPKG